MVRRCTDEDFDAVHEIINDGARAYQGVVPADCWHEPYMSRSQLHAEIQSGVDFWCLEDADGMQGVMGIQEMGEVTLIRHAYVRGARQRAGIGSDLLAALRPRARRSILIGTWRDAAWATSFYQKHGFALLGDDEAAVLLRKYWKASESHFEASVVLAEESWFAQG